MPTMPALPTFSDRVVVSAAQLNAMKAGVEALTQIATGKPTSAGHTTRPRCKVALLNPKLILGATAVSWDTADTDSDHMWSETFPSQLTIQTPGWYRLVAQGTWDFASPAAAAKNERFLDFTINGTADTESSTTNAVASCTHIMGVSSGRTRPVRQMVRAGVLPLTAGSTVYLIGYQDSANVYPAVNSAPAKTGLNLLPNTRWGTWLAAQWEAPL